MLALLLVAPLLMLVSAQVPVPSTPPGFTIGKGSAEASVQLEVFVDLLCPYSKDAFGALKRLVQHVSPSQFRLRVHQFPLPYHQHAYSVAQASETIAYALGPDSFEAWVDAVFRNQDRFGNKATELQGQANVTAQLAELAYQTFPSLSVDQWADGMSGHGGTARDSDTRVAWKYACSRGVTGTPTFLLNDVVIDDPDPDWTLKDWLKFLNPFLYPSEDVEEKLSIASKSTLPRASTIVVCGLVTAGVGIMVAALRLRRQQLLSLRGSYTPL